MTERIVEKIYFCRDCGKGYYNLDKCPSCSKPSEVIGWSQNKDK